MKRFGVVYEDALDIIFVSKEKAFLTSAKNAPFWLLAIWKKSSYASYSSYKVSILQSLPLKV